HTGRADATRPDVAAAHRHHGAAHGFDVEVPAVAGANELCVRVLGVGGGGDLELGCRVVDHAVDPIGSYQIGDVSPGAVTVAGWALDPNTPAPVNVTVIVDGVGVPM